MGQVRGHRKHGCLPFDLVVSFPAAEKEKEKDPFYYGE